MSVSSRVASCVVALVLVTTSCSSGTAAVPAAEGIEEPATEETRTATATSSPMPSQPPESEPIQFEASVEFLDEVRQRMVVTPHRFETFLPDDVMEETQTEGPALAGTSDGTWVMASLAGLAIDGSVPTLDEPTAVMISNGADLYMYLRGMRMSPVALPSVFAAEAADGWIFFDGTEIAEQLGADLAPKMNPGTFITDPDIWSELNDAISLREGPPSMSRGVATRTILVELDPVAGLPPELGQTTTVVFETDASGFVRSISGEHGRTDIFDIGAEDIVVELPAGATDLTGQWIAEVESQTGGGTPMTEEELAELDELLGAADDRDAEEPGPPQVTDLLAAQPELSVFLALLEDSGLGELVNQPGVTWTVLAPTNYAIEQMGDELEAMRNDPALRSAFVSQHLIIDAIDQATMLVIGSLQPFDGAPVTAASEGDSVVLNGDVYVIVSDIATASGFMHIIASPLD